ncbi:MAG: SUMF1/EgtB/PvdO family nonheme iron enzyme [Planctomycetes bacterium]|nr:SUMF1/EgtB/PvdO family nonheme iron enzyme [Planctomycetota bacterium]
MLTASLAKDTVLGEYRILEQIGEGGFGRVYRANHVLLKGPEFALKTLLPELAKDSRFRERFLREAQVLLSLEHPNLVPIRHVGKAGDHLYLVMALCPGRPLKDLLKEMRRVPMATTAAVASQVLAGLEHAHAKGVVHRDLKPANLLVDTSAPDGWHVRVIDFGIAKLLVPNESAAGEGGENGLTGDQQPGTRAYMSPEQHLNERVDARSDLYSLGVILHEMVVGERPSPLLAPPQSFTAAGLAVRLPGFEDLILTAMARDPAARHASARAMKHTLEAILRAAELETRRPGPEPAVDLRVPEPEQPPVMEATGTEPSTPSEAAPPPPRSGGGVATVASAATTVTADASTVDPATPRPNEVALSDMQPPGATPPTAGPQAPHSPTILQVPAEPPQPPVAPVVAAFPLAGGPVVASDASTLDQGLAPTSVLSAAGTPALNFESDAASCVHAAVSASTAVEDSEARKPRVSRLVADFPLAGGPLVVSDASTMGAGTDFASRMSVDGAANLTESSDASRPHSQQGAAPLGDATVVEPSALASQREANAGGEEAPEQSPNRTTAGSPTASVVEVTSQRENTVGASAEVSPLSGAGTPSAMDSSPGQERNIPEQTEAATPVRPGWFRAVFLLASLVAVVAGAMAIVKWGESRVEIPPSHPTDAPKQHPGRVEGVEYQAAMGAGEEALGRDHPDDAVDFFARALSARPGDQKATEAVQRAKRARAHATIAECRLLVEAAIPSGSLPVSEHPYDAARQIARAFAEKHESEGIAPEIATYRDELERREVKAVKTAHDAAIAEAREKAALADWVSADAAVGRARGFRIGSKEAASVEFEIREGRARAALDLVKAKALAAIPTDIPPGVHPFRAAIEMVRAFAEGPDVGPSDHNARKLLEHLQREEAHAVTSGHDKALAEAREKRVAHDRTGAATAATRALQFVPGSAEADGVLTELRWDEAREALEAMKVKARAALPSGDTTPDPHPHRASIQLARAFVESSTAEPILKEARDFLASIEKQEADAVRAGLEKALSEARSRIKSREWKEAGLALERALAFDSRSVEAARVRVELESAKMPPRPDAGSVSIVGLTYTAKNAQGYEEYRHDKTGILLVLLPGGEFWMGSPVEEAGRETDEDRHRVKVAGFLLGKTEVTNSQFRNFRAKHFSGSGQDADTQPAVLVSWSDAIEFCSWASLRLPTEVEWEYAARAGDDRTFPWGTSTAWPPPLRAGNLGSIAGLRDDFLQTAPVGNFQPSPWGLYDLAGNASEWCSDEYRERYSIGDPSPAPDTATEKCRVARGASWMDKRPDSMRCADRRPLTSAGAATVGFRVALSLALRK